MHNVRSRFEYFVHFTRIVTYMSCKKFNYMSQSLLIFAWYLCAQCDRNEVIVEENKINRRRYDESETNVNLEWDAIEINCANKKQIAYKRPGRNCICGGWIFLMIIIVKSNFPIQLSIRTKSTIGTQSLNSENKKHKIHFYCYDLADI